MNRRKTGALVVSAMAAVLFCGMRDVCAEGEIVVTAARDARDVSATAANVTVISSDDLKQSKCLNMVDALGNLGGIHVRSITGNPASSEVDIRGFGENAHGRVLVLLDGRKLNGPDMAGINWLQVPISNIERIEIVRGGNSALYGDHAVGGVINIITRKGQKVPVADVSVDVGSYRTVSARAGLAASEGRLNYSVNGERYESDGYRDRTAFLSQGAGVNMGYDVNDDVNATLALSGQTVENELPGWLNKEEMKQDRKRSNNPSDEVKTDFLNADAGLAVEFEEDQSARMNVSFGRKDMISDMVSWYSFADQTIDTFAVMPRVVLQNDLIGRENNLILGVDWYIDSLDVDRYTDKSRTSESMSAGVDKITAGLYARNELEVYDNVVLGAGARAESSKVEADVLASGLSVVDENVTHRENAVDLSVVKTFERKSKLFARTSTVYRYPFVDEQVSYFGFGSDEFYSDIDPEEGWNLEAGSEIVPCDNFTAGITLFMLTMEDEIAWNNDTMRNENLDETRRQGAELNLSYKMLDVCELVGNYTFTDGEFIAGVYDGNDIPLVPVHKASLNVIVDLPSAMKFDARINSIGESYLGGDKDNTGEKLDGYATVDTFLRYVSSYVSGLEAYAGVENLLNEKYASLGYKGWEDAYYPSPERSYKGGVSYRF